MATISEMLLNKDSIIPAGNLEPVRKVVKEYKEILEKYIKEHPEYSESYEPGNRIGSCYFEGQKMKLSFSCGSSKVKFDLYSVSVGQLEYVLKEEGLKIIYGNGPTDGLIFIHFN